ncbi:LEAF RUST 10 DISEASE-RESISTANCE LOCUS RECEPTOR-LIKE PROTEIN KINASE-like 1.1 isoform X3 [Salvia hispanica]|uniref:LEAF RUST 10 DISEASE-RESISTANCE LOCUS RECEPTOR-LIKE PROTEIN KINASE-like 1.1 isoform X3 n=1 Tax=Salvia hispanica TaxID=49212 RepID=UPI0020097BE8|nr:LEAF RUST 10 DISEASE-RESISTANCE LOCUS RECEPTOR-LIKE PROTEIN KINASE-like 1.1 isoform X3 [Salvia hispanica]
MVVVSKHVLFLLLCLLLLPQSHSKCKESYSCRNFTLRFPFTDIRDPGCGLFAVGGCNSTSQEEHPRLHIGASTSAKYILNQPSNNTFTILDFLLQTLLESPRCFSYMNVSLPQSPSVSFTFSPNITFFACFNKSSNDEIQEYFESYRREECDASTLYYKIPATESHNGVIPRECSLTQLPVKSDVNSTQLSEMLTYSFSLEWSVSEDCDRCYRGGGQCLADNRNQFYCEKTGYCRSRCETATIYYKPPPAHQDHAPPTADCVPSRLPYKSGNSSADLLHLLTGEYTLEWNVSQDCNECHHGGGQCYSDNRDKFYCHKENNLRKILLATLIPGSALLLVCALYIWLRKKKKVGSYLLSRNLSYDPSSKADIEDGSFNFGIPIFSYSELVEATGNFDPSKELGDGGFGTVYYGKLHDGREVAIKRLYEHNYRRVEQFLNEIKILTSLRHPNLVSLYGCTSRRSRELLLVYEYIPNGTVADHLHGQRAASAPLTWPMRMTIARETATALAYLHKSDIIHRDVKTNNILLDANFSVKVADFGLSRLFPNDVTHISTAPQGTPGYVDPEYHQCYQLTDKSDVYSFGVVLIELISSMPAVDISRHKHEINLANLAVSKIQKCAFDELIDPATGYNSDAEVTRMTTTVAELAFRCLQLDKDMRPTMEEVVAILHDIESGGDGDFEGVKGNSGGKIPPSPETDEVVLLKSRIYRSSPTAVTDTWISSASTTASSVG